jgi:hypothetical protein
MAGCAQIDGWHGTHRGHALLVSTQIEQERGHWPGPTSFKLSAQELPQLPVV